MPNLVRTTLAALALSTAALAAAPASAGGYGFGHGYGHGHSYGHGYAYKTYHVPVCHFVTKSFHDPYYGTTYKTVKVCR